MSRSLRIGFPAIRRGGGVKGIFRTLLQRLFLPAALAAMAACSPPAPETSASTTPAVDAPAPVLVEVSRPTRGLVVRRIEVVGSLEPWEEAMIYAKTSGYLKSIGYDRGDRVRKGQLIAVLHIPEMADELEQIEAKERQAAAEVEKARADVRLQEVTVRRVEAIQKEEPRAVTAQEVDLAGGKLEAARATLAAAESRREVASADLAHVKTMLQYARITAPFDGMVTDRFVDPGTLVTAGTQSKPTPIVRVVNASRLRVTVDVPEREVGYLRVGAPGRLRVEAYPDRIFHGTVSRFSRALDPGTRTMRTEVLVDNEDGALAAGMFGKTSLDLEKRENVLTLAPAALRYQKDQSYVFVAEDGRARRVNVVCGADDGRAVEIVSGLTGAESVITEASAPLSDGDSIRVAARRGATGGGGP